MVGYDSESFILESVIHSIHGRDPDKVSKYSGYYGLMISSAILAGITSHSVPDAVPTVTQNSTEFVQHERRYSDYEIKLLSAAFAGISAIAIVTFSLIPSRSVENSLESTEKKYGFVESFSEFHTIFESKTGKIEKCAKDPKMRQCTESASTT
uniref:Col_cuticle_N domain-containing protein n=1 Tax=Caenorhabditis tropicalis TaxID=1561998 RepID=A0A1I7UZ98_9PELO